MTQVRIRVLWDIIPCKFETGNYVQEREIQFLCHERMNVKLGK